MKRYAENNMNGDDHVDCAFGEAMTNSCCPPCNVGNAACRPRTVRAPSETASDEREGAEALTRADEGGSRMPRILDPRPKKMQVRMKAALSGIAVMTPGAEKTPMEMVVSVLDLSLEMVEEM